MKKIIEAVPLGLYVPLFSTRSISFLS